MQQIKVGEHKSFKLYGLFSLLLISTTLNAEDFADFKRVQNHSFRNYLNEQDSKFKSILERDFQEYKANNAIKLYEKPKPKNMMIEQEKHIESVGPKVRLYVAPDSLKGFKKEKSVLTPKESKKGVDINFFGSSLSFSVDAKIREASFYPQTQKGIANFFLSVTESEYTPLLEEIKAKKESMSLNDWGVYLLVNRISKKIFQTPDDANLLSWFLFNKLGYSVKVAIARRHTSLIYYSKEVIYAKPSYKFAQRNYYLLSQTKESSVENLYTYKDSYSKSSRAFDFTMKKLPKFEEESVTKVLRYRSFGREYTYPFSYNKNLIDFYATYPQVEYTTYFNTPLEERTYSDIVRVLKKNIDGMSSSSAINFVLHFVQKAFVYERDEDQFSKEKVMFAEETLVYNKSDCEDRAILFAYLVKRIFKISVVGVKYSDHMATALYIPLEGDSVKVGGRRYVIADPTYINANIGMSMPKYKSLRPESFIRLRD